MAALAVAAVVAVFVTLPAAAPSLDARLPAGQVRGAIHIHTDRSDGNGSVEAVAESAAAAGLDFIILTDHGDGTRPPRPPSIVSGVLVIDGLEVSATDGHVLALGLTGPTPFPLGGQARDVVDDIHRFGGLAFAAHPDSPKEELRWRAQGAAIDGFEWLNADSEWRDEPPTRLAGALVHGWLRGPESVASLFGTRPRRFARWSAGRRARVALAGHDAHGGGGSDVEARRLIGRLLPGYQSLFSTIAQVVDVGEPLTGQPAPDATRLLAAIAEGRTYTTIRAFADPGVLEFAARQGSGPAVPMGSRLDPGEVRVEARVASGDVATVVLVDRGRQLASGRGSLTWQGEPDVEAALWVEARWPGREFPWIVSNPIFGSERFRDDPMVSAPDPASEPDRHVELPADDLWQVERDQDSTGERTLSDAGVRLAYSLGRGPSPYAALVRAIEGRAGYREVVFEASSPRVMRVSVQVRLPGRDDGQRWGRSVVLDETPRVYRLRLEDFDPIGHATSLRPVAAEVRSLLFVVDSVNAAPGATGSFVIRQVRLGVGGGGDDDRPGAGSR